MTPRRAIIALSLLALLGNCLLALAVLVERGLSEPVDQPTPVAGLPTIAPPEPVPTDAEPLPIADMPTATPWPAATDDLNILLLGTDRRPGKDPSWRTDTIIVVAIRPQARLVAMLSVPRDLWVNIPGYGPARINTADYLGERQSGRGGGPKLLAATLEQNLRIPVHGYVRVNFAGLERIIDAVGGITVEARSTFDEWMDVDTPHRWHLYLTPGSQHLDGHTALGYARSRRLTSDFDRSRRQQEILLAIRDAALRPAVLSQVPRLLVALCDAVETDLSPGVVLSLVRLASQVDPASYRTRVFDATMVRDWVTPKGAMVLLPNRARIEQVWAEMTAP